ncbi:hypothetical protein HYH03_012161 [Edaphochlamys debaryana]|uniref:Peptidase M3A/M3B catalytic domain-containing protein n=1 Tax=Edaphochlamys debaryana TaxID=47281 RepID=A0A835XT89_9CHLO|nr:hypothetical protein HYH03_012161 [Edaphochlamys debaryana]|eukprot:KAG2489329.1 hypothetical protein HYH03_012161 [Edaphochlamys debaryana]
MRLTASAHRLAHSQRLLLQARRTLPASGFATLATAKMATAVPATEVVELIDRLNAAYEKVHVAYEENFWSTKMALAGSSSDALASTKTAYDAFLADPANLAAVRKAQADAEAAGVLSEDQAKALRIMERTFACYITEDPKAAAIKEKINQLEAALAQSRNTMKLGYTDPSSGEHRAASSVQLRNTMRVADDEATRKACYEGVRSIGPFVAEGFVAIVKERNRLARMLGYEDFYDYKVTQAEGFGKRRLFEIMDGLEAQTRPIMEAARERLAREKGASALEPWNMGWALAGDTEKAQDPYFPFEQAVDVWARTFAALGIEYKGSTMTLDLCDRSGKYSNGFCHWPQVAWRRPDGAFVPAKANFTSLATPSQVGSGKTALVTLLHEGGHAAHFANIDQPSPFFSQERAPTSVAYAETQSMFLDALAHDAAWLGRYACSRSGEVMPWHIIEAGLKATQPYDVFALRAMIAVPYFEKALYELPESELTVERLLSLADEVETRVQGGLSPRPLLSVPHPLSDESSCYYHGYVLAEMAVKQTRAHFLSKYGKIVDNDHIGKELTEGYWRPGNGAAFLDLVAQVTGKPLAADDWVHDLQRPLEAVLKEEEADYKAAIAAGPAIKPGQPFDLGMRVRLVHGDELISDSAEGGLAAACDKFKAWVDSAFPKGA